MEGPPPLRQDNLRLYRIDRQMRPIPREKPRAGGILGALAALGALVAKFFGPIAKFLPVILKAGGTMLLSIGAYAIFFGWRWAVGVVLLILVHECGHVIVAKMFGLKVRAMVFVPFMGASVALEEAPRNAWLQAWVSIGGPLLGALGALACHGIGLRFEAPLFITLAWTGYWLNLFNLIPLNPLDGGRIATALSPWLWLVGLTFMGLLAWQQPNGMLFILLVFLLIQAVPSILSLFRKRTDVEQRYLEVSASQRFVVAVSYFSLMAALVVGMHVADTQLKARGIGPNAGASAQ